MTENNTTAPDCLLWQLVKPSHSKLLKAGKFSFSRELGNVTYQHNSKSTGYTNKNRIDVLPAAEGSLVKLHVDTGKSLRRPRARVTTKKYTKTLKNQAEVRAVAKKVRRQVASQISNKFAKLVSVKTIKKTE